MADLLSDAERVAVRKHLGYLQVQQAQTFVLGIPAAVQTIFVIEGAMQRVLPEAVPEVRRLLGILDRIEDQMVGDLELLAIESIDEIHVRKDEQRALWIEYNKWRNALADLFGVIANPFSRRAMAAGSVNISVAH